MFYSWQLCMSYDLPTIGPSRPGSLYITDFALFLGQVGQI